MSLTLILPPLTPEDVAKRSLNRQLELSLKSAEVLKPLKEAWQIPSRYAEITNDELARLWKVGDRAVAMTQPGAEEHALSAARVAFVDAIARAVRTIADTETHSQKQYILEGARQLERHLFDSGVWAGVIAAYHASLENGR